MDNAAMEEVWVPIIMFLTMGAIFILFFYFRFRTRREFQQTLRIALDKGAELTPDVLDRLGEPARPKTADLRRGLFGLFIGIAFAVFGLVLGEEDAIRPLLAVGAFPFLVGIAYLGLWKFRE
ncbi:MAG: DUF6249 domain-containing protein [Gammaproteobacteria bacterium]